MGTITGQALADNAAGLVQDVDRIRWEDTDWLQWLNDGHREAVLAKPEINVNNAPVTLTADSTKQSMPTGAIQLFNVPRNMGSDGLTPGNAIRVVSRDVMDTTDPTWHTQAATGEITNYMYDPRDPLHYYVYPQAPSTPWQVELVYSAIPAELTLLSETINLDDVYANALLNYMLYRAHSRDSIYGDQAQEAQLRLQAFMTALGVKTATEVSVNPNLTTAPYSSETQATGAKPAG